MAREFEIIGAGALGALLHRKAKHSPPEGSACANCGTALAGPYCHVCGQDADDHHRSIAHLAWEGLEGLTHLDGRLAQTLPLLLFRPGRLARDHLEGRRARHVPPFRLFLICLLVFMFVLESLFHQARTVTADRSVRLPGASATSSAGPAPGAKAAGPQDVSVDANLSFDTGKNVTGPAGAKHLGHHSDLGAWLRPRLKRALANREYYSMVLFTWAHRLAVLLLPILAGLLALTYVRRRQFFIYDHLIVAMQFLSFQFLVFAVAWLVPDPAQGWAVLIATLWTPVNLYMILRGAYGSGVITAGVKTLFLWSSSLILFAALVLGLLTLALAQM
jgi:hypothetical protein